jgi:hypothetical protein
VAIPPDTKDWTWILERPCPDCGFDASTIERAALGAAFREVTDGWMDVLAGGDLDHRPSPTIWSPLEYGCHVRDVLRIAGMRVFLLQTRDDPTFSNWDQDATAVAERYREQDPRVVAIELRDAGQLVAGRLDDLTEGEWWRTGRRSNGSAFTIETLSLYILHDPIHHLWDVGAETIAAREGVV